MQLDYLKSVLVSGHLYSVPDVSSAVLQAAAAMARPAEAAEHLERGASDGSMLFFRVLDTGIGTKKLLPTSGAATAIAYLDSERAEIPACRRLGSRFPKASVILR